MVGTKPDLEERLQPVRKDQFKSEGERRIAQYFESCGIRYVYEQGVLVYDGNKPRIMYPDFLLPDFATYLEYYGLAGNPEYDQGIKRKKTIYAAMGLDVIPVYPWTFCDDWQGYIRDSIRGILNRRLKVFSDKLYRRPALAYSKRGFGGYSGHGRYR